MVKINLFQMRRLIRETVKVQWRLEQEQAKATKITTVLTGMPRASGNHSQVEDGAIRLEFRRKGKDGKKPNRILWSVPPAMRCFMTDFVVLYGENVRQVRSRNPEEPIVCDRYHYDEDSDMHVFYLKDEVQLKLQGGEYVLPMDEFMITAVRDLPDASSVAPQ